MSTALRKNTSRTATCGTAEIFVFRTDAFLDEYRQFEPGTVDAVAGAVQSGRKGSRFPDARRQGFGRATAKSVDYAVMEKTKLAAVVPVSYGWSDVGSWNSVWELSEAGR